ncbi:MAG: FtsX-like permease family protein [Prevotella sp.]|nr:FtsX-like permease family protein [Prevotella sp.]
MNIVKGMIYMARRFKAATALNVIGLIVAFAAFYLFATQVDYMQSYNCGIANYKRIYRVESMMTTDSNWGTHSCRPTLELIAKMPQVDGMTLIASYSEEIELHVGETAIKANGVLCTHTPFGAMQRKCIDGELEFQEGMEKTCVIIPASLARKLFRQENVAGRYVWSGTDSLKIHGVYEDFPENCSMKNYAYVDMGEQDIDSPSEWSYLGYILLHEGIDSETVFKDFAEQMRKTLYKQMMESAGQNGYDLNDEENKNEFDRQFKEAFGDLNYRLRPISETYFSGVDANMDKGNPSVFLVLRLACVLILLIALINFLNFILAESPMRIKGINTRRVLGESITSLRFGLVAESVLLSLIACIIALGLVYVVTQEPTELLQGSLALGDHLWLVVLTLVFAVVIGVVAGVYPAWFATSFAPALALKGSFGLTPKGKQLRTVLVGLQLFISLLLTSYISILYLQSHYIYNSDYGYDKDELLYAYLPKELKEKRDALRTELMQLPGVDDVSYSRFVLGSNDTYMNWGRVSDNHVVSFFCMPVDWHYFNTFGIKVVEGRDFNEHDGDVMIINEAARKQWDWVEIDKPYIKDSEPVVGVCENIRFGSTRVDRTAKPLAFIIFGESKKDWGDQLGVVNIRVGANIDKVQMRQRINDLLQKMSNSTEVEAKFLDQQMEQLYRDEFRFMKQVLWFAAVCLVITLIGVFCLTMFETEYRRKEIGIRKVMGSSTQEILLMFCRHYALLLLISFVVATPVAYYVGSQWLQGFAERTPIYWWLFPLALLIVGTITMITVVAQCWRTANENPVNSIKNE